MSSSSPQPEAAAPGQLRLDHPAPGVARLTISNPGKRGALDHAILGEFARVLPELEARALIITGEGRTFSAGYDIGDLPDSVFADAAERLIAHPFAAAIEAIEAYPYPTIAALNGHAIGGGLELAISCDLRVAADGIKLGMPPGKLGLVYSHTGLRKFIDVIGAARTRDLFLTSRRIEAARAEQWGLVTEIVAEDQLTAHVLELAGEIASNAPLAQIGNKQVIEAVLGARAALPAELERELIELRLAAFASEDFREGVNAFAQKRAPQWKGR